MTGCFSGVSVPVVQAQAQVQVQVQVQMQVPLSTSATAIASTSRRKEGVESTLSHRDAGGGRGLRATTSC